MSIASPRYHKALRTGGHCGIRASGSENSVGQDKEKVVRSYVESVCVRACVCEPEVNVRCLFLSPSILFFETRPPTETVAPLFAWAGRWSIKVDRESTYSPPQD